VSSTDDPALRNLLHDTLGTRDQITADLAKGDAAALSEIQPVLSKLEQTAKHCRICATDPAQLSDTQNRWRRENVDDLFLCTAPTDSPRCHRCTDLKAINSDQFFRA
jgi:hypothetical protein